MILKLVMYRLTEFSFSVLGSAIELILPLIKWPEHKFSKLMFPFPPTFRRPFLTIFHRYNPFLHLVPKTEIS